MEKFISSFQDLTNDQLYDLLKLRQDVFVIEQDCIYQDFDGFDKQAVHFLIYKNGAIAAYSRIFAPGIKYKENSSIGRIIVSKQFRGGELGRLLITESIEYCLENFPGIIIKIEAQAHLKEYYRKLGFDPYSEIYEVDEIPHLEMILDPTTRLA